MNALYPFLSLPFSFSISARAVMCLSHVALFLFDLFSPWGWYECSLPVSPSLTPFLLLCKCTNRYACLFHLASFLLDLFPVGTVMNALCLSVSPSLPPSLKCMSCNTCLYHLASFLLDFFSLGTDVNALCLTVSTSLHSPPPLSLSLPVSLHVTEGRSVHTRSHKASCAQLAKSVRTVGSCQKSQARKANVQTTLIPQAPFSQVQFQFQLRMA